MSIFYLSFYTCTTGGATAHSSLASFAGFPCMGDPYGGICELFLRTGKEDKSHQKTLPWAGFEPTTASCKTGIIPLLRQWERTDIFERGKWWPSLFVISHRLSPAHFQSLKIRFEVKKTKKKDAFWPPTESSGLEPLNLESCFGRMRAKPPPTGLRSVIRTIS